MDGIFGRKTRTAIQQFQSSLGSTETGYLTADQVSQLGQVRKEYVDRIRFEAIYDELTGVGISLPMVFVDGPKPSELGSRYNALSGSRLIIDVFGGQSDQSGFRTMYEELSKDRPDQTYSYRYMDEAGWFVVSKKTPEGSLYSRVFHSHDQARGFVVFWDPDRDEIMSRVSIAMFNSIVPFAGPGLTREQSVETGPGGFQDGDDDRPESWSGTGIVVTSDGHVLTNNHVVENCVDIKVADVPARLVAADGVNDLAVLLPESRVPGRNVARFRPDQPRLGEDISVIGYPLSGLLSGVNVTKGEVSSLIGIGGDTDLFQISAPVQSGNSGGPVIDQQGSVVGVVTSKLKALAVAEISGDLPQNVNFAIRSTVAMNFLSAHDVKPRRSSSLELADKDKAIVVARDFTVFILCNAAIER